MNCWFTWKVQPTWHRFILFPSTTVPNFLVTIFGTIGLVEALHMPESWAGFVSQMIAIPITFLLTRFILTGQHNKDQAPKSREPLPAQNVAEHQD